MAETGGLWIIDAEEGDTSEFDATTVEADNELAAGVDYKAHGTYGFRAYMGGSNDAAWGRKNFTEQSDIYVRMYVYISDNFDINTAYGTSALLRLYDGENDHCLSMGMRDYSGDGEVSAWYYDIQEGSNGQSDTNFSTGEWHYIEIHWVSDESAGGGEIWVDGDLIISDVDQNTSALVPDNCRAGINYASAVPDLGDYLLFDDIKADTSPIGAYSDAGGAVSIGISPDTTFLAGTIINAALAVQKQIGVSPDTTYAAKIVQDATARAQKRRGISSKTAMLTALLPDATIGVVRNITPLSQVTYGTFYIPTVTVRTNRMVGRRYWMRYGRKLAASIRRL